MAANPVYCALETERAYWQTRLANLERLLCELLIKNEQLRQERLMFTSAQSDQGNSSNGFLKGLMETGSKSKNCVIYPVGVSRVRSARQLRSEP